MKQIIEIYKANRETVEHFILTSLSRLQPKKLDELTAKRIFTISSCIKLVYGVDNEYLQSTPYYYRNNSDTSKLGLSKAHYFDRIVFDINGTYVSNPYISSETGNAGITYAQKMDDDFIVIDLDLLCVLEQLQLVHSNRFIYNLNRIVYGFMGFSLLFFALFLGVFAIYTFVESILHFETFELESTFRAIIALTLGLAIYDLAKTILEHEIFFKSINLSDIQSNEMLSKFLKSIIIALSIESLMVVFKITLKDHTQLIHAFFLILGVSFMIYVLGKFNYLSNPKNHAK